MRRVIVPRVTRIAIGAIDVAVAYAKCFCPVFCIVSLEFDVVK